jgi:threonine synthase
MPTISPSMDIQVSSNFERLLFEALGRDGAAVGRLMASLAQSGRFELPAGALERIRAEFSAERVSEDQTRETMRRVHELSGYVLDPHTAVGVAAAARYRGAEKAAESPVVTLATAHPAKFPAAVKAATGVEPGLPLWLADLYGRAERYDVLANDQAAVEAYVSARSRAAG